MAVPDILGARYAVAGKPRAGRRWSARRQIELHGHRGHLAWVHHHRLLPAHLVRVRRPLRARDNLERDDRIAHRVELPLLPTYDADVDQVEMNGVGVGREVEDPPPLNLAL